VDTQYAIRYTFLYFQAYFKPFSPDIVDFSTAFGILRSMQNFLHGRLMVVRLSLLAAVCLLLVVGIVVIYAVGHPADSSGGGQSAGLGGLWKKQILFAIVGLLGFIVVNLIDYRKAGALSYWFYAGILVLLGLLLLDKFVALSIGGFASIPVRNGTRRWIEFSVGPKSVSIQPSEFCKLAYIVALAWYLRYRSNYRRFRGLIGPFVLTLLPMVMIMLEPDLGTVLLMMPVLFVMLFAAGAKVKHLAIIILLALLVSPVMWVKMNPYQRIRISSVLLQNKWVQKKAQEHPAVGKILVGKQFDVKQWKNDWGYHLIRSKYAVTSGGLSGYGYRKGPFVKYNFLPARHNDFIFATIGHQWGFLGCVGILVVFTIIVLCGLEIGVNNTDPFARLVAIGIVAMISVEVLVNVGMAVGIMPITGLNLPFVSYGGSSLLVHMIAIGLLNNIGRHRPFSVAGRC